MAAMVANHTLGAIGIMGPLHIAFGGISVRALLATKSPCDAAQFATPTTITLFGCVRQNFH